MRHLGALGFLLFWMLAASGIYLYLRFDTSASGAYASIGELEWWFGGVLRSVHRYAADAFVLVTILHLAREMWLGRFRVGARSLDLGHPARWLLYASGLVGYWLVGHALAVLLRDHGMDGRRRASAKRPIACSRSSSSCTSACRSRCSPACGCTCSASAGRRPCRRARSWGCAAMLVAAALRPAVSEPRWDPARAAGMSRSTGSTSSSIRSCTPPRPRFCGFWSLGASALLLLLPYVLEKRTSHRRAGRSGELQRLRPLYRGLSLQRDRAQRRRSCFPSAAPPAASAPAPAPPRRLFAASSTSSRNRASGPHDAGLARGCGGIAVPRGGFCCEKTPSPGAIALRCLAMLPPSVVEYALRRGRARRPSAAGDCAYRLGMELCDERFAARREPHLRATVRSSRRNNEYSFVLR